ncbi:uncharacterized protein LOC121550903 isoform X1 [Coregonus clupeaformis]|uniref:uncharacterized protein LOC121550903 isoform X1 n=1 Tax=Coregonus clupeaformis TaxID=59861 RepID=UPI001BE05C7E|nr:uncharacterized protein LOC121550903 isoform X1 [Coregonus clupeaformis]
MSTCTLLLLSQTGCGLCEYPQQCKPPVPKELSVNYQPSGENKSLSLCLEEFKTSEPYKPIGEGQLSVYLKKHSGQSKAFDTSAKSMPAEHCEVSELIEAMDSSEPSEQSAEPCIIVDEIKNSLDYTEPQKVNGQMDPSVHSADHYNMNGEHAEESKPSVHYNRHSVGFEQCINKPCEDYPALHKHTNQCKSSKLSKSFEQCTQHCECFEFSKSSEHCANDCLASVFRQHCEHCTGHFQSSEQCKPSDQHCMSFEPSKPAESSVFFEQCKIYDFIPDISESTKSIRSFEHCTGICEYSEKYNHIEHPTEYNETTMPCNEDLKFCTTLEPIHSSDLNKPSQRYAEQVVPNESRHVSKVCEPTEQTLLTEQSSHQSAEYDIPSGHCELQNNLYEQSETSVQCELSERCNSCERCPGQHQSINDKYYEPSIALYSEEDKSSECSSIETRYFESCIDDSMNSDPLTDSAESYEALVEEGAPDKSSDDKVKFCSEIWESFDNCPDAVECEESNPDEDKPHSDAVVVEEFFDLFDKEDTYTFSQRRPYTSCFEGGGVHEHISEQLKPHMSIMNEEETHMPCAKKRLEPLALDEKINENEDFSQEEVDESYETCAEDRQLNVDCADDEASASGSFAEEETCESCFEEASAYEVDVYEAFVAKENAIKAEAHKPFVEEDELCIAEDKAGEAQANEPLVDEDNMYEHSAEEASHGSSADVSFVDDDEAYEGQNDQTYEPCFEKEKTCDEENQKIRITEDELYKPYARDKAYGSYEQCGEDCIAYGCEHTTFSTEGEAYTLCTEEKACDEEHHEYESKANESNVNQEANGFCDEEDSHDTCNEGIDDSTPETYFKDGVCTEEGEHDAPCAEESECSDSFEVITKDTVLCTEGSKPAMPDGIAFNGDQTDSSTTSLKEIDEQNKSSELCEDLNTPYLSENWEEHNGVSEHLQPSESEDFSEQVSKKTSPSFDGAEHSKNSMVSEPPEHHAEQTEPAEKSELDEKMESHEFFKIVASEQPSEESEEELSDDESEESCECEYCVPPRDQVPAKPLLPQIKSKDAGKICVVIDLDETLVHSSFKPLNNADFIIPVEIDGTVHQVYVLKRPHVDEYLRRMGELFECVLFTASLSKYADPVSDLLDKWGAFQHRLFRESCVFHRGNYVKDLSRLGRDLNKVIIVDNSPASYIFHSDNAVPVASWFDDMADTELLDLIPFFERLSKVDDVYDILKQQRTAS